MPTRTAVAALALTAALAGPARADNPSYAVIMIGVQVSATDLHHAPTGDAAFTTTAMPTFGTRGWGPRQLPLWYGVHIDALAAAGHLSAAPRVMPILGTDAGLTFPLAGGRAGVGAAFNAVNVAHPAFIAADDDHVNDVAGQLRYTRPFAHRVRIDLMLAVGATGGPGHDKGSLFASQAQVIVKLARRLSVYGAAGYEVRTYEDAAAAEGELVFTTAMFRAGVGLHNLGPIGFNDF